MLFISLRNGYAQSIIDNNLLEGVRRWLEPLPDKSLPALNIQSAFFDILGKMYIDTNTLKDSQLGRIVLFYTKCKRVTSAIQRQAVALVSVWSRPIVKRSASYVSGIHYHLIQRFDQLLFSVIATFPWPQKTQMLPLDGRNGLMLFWHVPARKMSATAYAKMRSPFPKPF